MYGELSIEGVSIKDLEDPEVEALIDDDFLVKNRAKLPQADAPVLSKNHCL